MLHQEKKSLYYVICLIFYAVERKKLALTFLDFRYVTPKNNRLSVLRNSKLHHEVNGINFNLSDNFHQKNLIPDVFSSYMCYTRCKCHLVLFLQVCVTNLWKKQWAKVFSWYILEDIVFVSEDFSLVFYDTAMRCLG